MAINLGVAEGYIELDFSALKQACAGAVKELEKIDREGALAQSELRKLEAASTGVKGAFQEAANASKKLSVEIDSAKRRVDTYQKGIQELNSHISQSKQKQEQLKQEIEKVTAQQERSQKKMESMSDAYRQAQKEIKAVTEEYGKNSEQAKAVAEQNKDIIDSYEKATKKVQEHTNTLSQLEEQQDMLARGIEESENRIVDFKTQINNTEAEISDLTRELNAAQNKAQVFGAAAKEAGEKWQAAGQKISGVGNALTMGVSLPIAGIGTAALKAGNDFEAQMSRVSAIAGAYGKDLEKLRDQAIQLGAETSFSATEAAQAMENLASAGFGTQEIMAAMPGMLDLAASSGEDLASSADIAASTLRGFQLEASEAGHVADVLAKNAADTNAAIIDTGYAMKYVAPVAQSAGWSLEEVAAAIGVLADSGIKGEQAGTTLRSALVRMMKPTEKMEKAMTDLGITFYDAEGKMKPLSTIIDELQDRTKELTDEQRDNRIATIFGTEALSGMKVLLASSKEELDQLTEGLENADGASRKMADTMLDNTKGSIEEMNGSLETAGITIQRHLAPWVTKGAKAVTNLANKFSELDEDTQGTILAIAGIAAATGPVVKIFGTLTSGVGTVTKGFGKLIDKLGSTSQIDKGAKALGGVSSVIGGIPTPAKLAVGAIAALGVGAFVAFRQMEKAAVEANLEEHFGSITLSAEELEDVAKRLTTTDWTIRLDAYIDAQQTLEEYQDTLESTIEELNQAKWKVDVGLELSTEEKESYKQTMLDYVTQVKDYISQQHYTANLAIDTVFTPGTQLYQNYKEFSDTYYNGLSEDLTKLGTELAELVNQAWEDGVLSQEEIDKLDEKQAEIQKKLDEISQARYDLTLDNIQADALEGGLTVESFQGLQKQMTENLDQRKQEIEDGTLELLLQWQVKLNNGEIDQQGFDLIKKQVDLEAQARLGEVTLQAVDVEIDTIKTNYHDELDKAAETFYTNFQKTFENHTDILEDGNWLSFTNILGNTLSGGVKEAIGDSQGAINELMKNMAPQTKDLENLASKYQNAGKSIPQNISKGLLDIYELEIMAGNTSHMYEFMGAQMSNSPEFLKMYEQSVDAGEKVPEGVAEGIYLSTGKIYKGAKEGWQQITTATDDSLPEILDYLNQEGMKPGDELAATLTAGTGIIYNEATSQWVSIKDAALNSEEEVKGVLSQCGIEASDALVNSLMEKSPEVRAQAVDLLAQMQNASDAEKPGLLMQFQNLGIEVDDSLKNGIISNLQVVKDGTGDMAYTLKTSSGEEIKNITPEFKEFLKQMGVKGVDKLEETVSDTKIDYPDMKDPNWTKEAKNGRDGMQGYLNQNPLSITAKIKAAGQAVVSAMRGYASGGIIDQPEFALVGEAGPESIIPLSAGKRSRALSLWEETGKRLGVPDMDLRAATLSAVSSSSRISQQFTEKMQLEIPVTPVIDYQRLAKTLREQFQKNPIVLEPDIRVTTNPTFVVGSKEIAVTIAPEVDAQLGQINKQRMRGM